MISFLRGTLREKRPPWLTLEVNGVGYEIEAPLSVFYELPDTGQPLNLHTHLVVREDAHLLFGFLQERMRNLFRSLLKVNGVGPKVALAVLSGLSAHEFLECVANNRIERLIRVPGIGRKTAERLVMEMRDRLEKDVETRPAADSRADGDAAADAVAALVTLGYKPQEAGRAVRDCAPGMKREDLIRQALRALSGAGSL
jgi:Holliday junction DNA helicase RuvA